MLPNGNVIGSKIINYTTSPMRRLEISIGIDYNTNLDFARSIVQEYLKKHPLIIQERHNYVFIRNYADSSIELRIRAWVTNENYWDAYKDVLNNIKSILDANKISIPFPQLDVCIKKTE